jgi:hypothetical protein
VRALVILVALCAWASPAAALDRAKAIEVAKKEAGERCAGDAACTFTAKVEEGKWHVRVDFPKGAESKSKTKFHGHTIYIINQTGRIVGRVEAKK